MPFFGLKHCCVKVTVVTTIDFRFPTNHFGVTIVDFKVTQTTLPLYNDFYDFVVVVVRRAQLLSIKSRNFFNGFLGFHLQPCQQKRRNNIFLVSRNLFKIIFAQNVSCLTISPLQKSIFPAFLTSHLLTVFYNFSPQAKPSVVL